MKKDESTINIEQTKAMTVRELINKLMDMDLDKPVYITEISDNLDKCVGFVENNPIKFSNYKIIDVDTHGLYGTFFNCITIKLNE